MNDIFVISKADLKELISTELRSELQSFFTKTALINQEPKPLVYRSRKYVKDLLQISYPTLDKYSEPGKGILKKYYFGRKVRYLDSDIESAMAILQDNSSAKHPN